MSSDYFECMRRDVSISTAAGAHPQRMEPVWQSDNLAEACAAQPWRPQLHSEREMDQILAAIEATRCQPPVTVRALDASHPDASSPSKQRTPQAFDVAIPFSLRPVSGAAHPDASSATPLTTLMVRNVPVQYSLEALLVEWQAHGIDYLHLPWNAGAHRNLSYAFINFSSGAEALHFMRTWQKQRLPQYRSQKPLNIRFSDTQGLTHNLLLVKKAGSNLDLCNAAVFENGQRIGLKQAVSKATARSRAANRPSAMAPLALSRVQSENTSQHAVSQALSQPGQWPGLQGSMQFIVFSL